MVDLSTDHMSRLQKMCQDRGREQNLLFSWVTSCDSRANKSLIFLKSGWVVSPFSCIWTKINLPIMSTVIN